MVIYRKMQNHFNKYETNTFPEMKSKSQRKDNNTYLNLIDYFEQMKQTGQYKKVFYPTTGLLKIWFKSYDNIYCIVSMNNTKDSCTIRIEYIFLDTGLRIEHHKFNPFGFSVSVNKHLLIQEDLEKQRVFRQQEQERENALEKAHDSFPQTCDPDTCKFCKEDTLYELCQPSVLGTYT